MQPCNIISHLLQKQAQNRAMLCVTMLSVCMHLIYHHQCKTVESPSYSKVNDCFPLGISHLSFQSHGRSGDEPRGRPWEVSRRHVHPTESAGPTNVKENGIKCKYDEHVV